MEILECLIHRTGFSGYFGIVTTSDAGHMYYSKLLNEKNTVRKLTPA